MLKNISLYIIAFIFIVVFLLFFNKAYTDLTNYSKLTNRHNTVYAGFQNLSRQLHNAAVLNPDLIKAGNSSKAGKIFFTDSLTIIRQLELLKSTVKDSVNTKICNKLDTLIKSELHWLLKNNVPDSIINNRSPSHVTAFERIDSLISQGIERTFYLIEYRKQQLYGEIRNVRIWILLFILLSGFLLIFTTINLFKQKSKRQIKEKELETVMNRISDGVVSVDNNWRYTFLNEAAMSTHPFTKEETLGKIIWDVHPEMKGTVFWDKYHLAMQSGKALEVDSYYAPMNTWFSVKVYPSANGLTIFYTDVTESKKAEKELLQTFILNKELVFKNKEKEKRAAELIIANKELAYQSREKENRAAELVVANDELVFQNKEKEKRAEELIVANDELIFQNEEKEKRAAELIIANKELIFQNEEKEKRAAELIIANKELGFQNEEKEKRAAELIIANKELGFQNEEKEKRAAELIIANKELGFQNEEKGKRAAELITANEELVFQNEEKEKRAAELIIANKELGFQNEEKEKRAAELVVANKELGFQNEEKEKRAAELIVANEELVFQNKEKEKRAAELIIANEELVFQNEEKENRAAELVVANKELGFQSAEKEKRAAELLIANKELVFQNNEKGKRASELSETLERVSFLASIADNIQDPVISTDSHFIITRWNQAAERLLEWKSEEVIGKTTNEVFNANYLDTSRDKIIELLEKNDMWQGEIIYHSKSGKPLNVLVTSSYLKDAGGNKTGYLILARDISKRKKAEEELKASNEELDSFTYSVSHDLRAPLRAVNGYAKMLEEDYDSLFDPEGKRLLGEVQLNAKKMGNLIDDLLAFSRLGRKEITKSLVDMTKLTEAVLSQMMQTIPGNAEINFKNLYPVMADYSLMEQVMTNLLSNAVKYSSKKEKSNIEITSQKKNGGIIYSVKDNGAGFDMEYAHKLFGVFQRLHSAQEFAGTGVGLAIVQRIIHKHAGKIWAEAKVGEGATFFFSLPDII